MGKHLGIPKDEVMGMLQGLKFASYEDNIKYFAPNGGTSNFVQTFNAASEIWKEQGVISKTVEANSVYNDSLLTVLYKK